MNKRRFDVLGLSEDGQVIGYLAKNELEEQADLASAICGSFKRDFEQADQVRESCPLEKCVSLLQEKEHLFVHTSGLVHGIITRADLHKQPVRMLLFSVISLLEMAILSLIREKHGTDALKLLGPKQRKDTRGLFKKRRASGVEIDLIDCLQLCGKGEIIRKTDTLRKQLGWQGKSKCQTFFGRLDRMRNALAHGQAFETVANMDWHKAVETFQEAQAVLRRSISMLDGKNDKTDGDERAT